MATASVPRVFLCSVFDAGMHEPVRKACPGLIWDPRQVRERNSERTIEDICRDLIRKSDLFVGIFDERGGRAPFEETIEPVTVLEIELLQALFQRMPIYLFIMPGFERNRRLLGLAKLAETHGLATIFLCQESAIEINDAHDKQLTEFGLASITRVIRDSLAQRTRRQCSAIASRLRPFRYLDMRILNSRFDAFSDPFNSEQVAFHLARADQQRDHAAKLSYLWPALRQLASVPYTDHQFFINRPLWEKLASSWDQSAAWYGMHDDSPIGRLAATNTIIWIQENSGASGSAALAYGARASAFYSMAKRLWWPWQRLRLFQRALDEVNLALSATLDNPANCLAIRGSVQLRLWRFSNAIADYEATIALRSQQADARSAQGEGWVELGWAYLHALRLREAKGALRKGIELMRQEWRRNPTVRVEFFSRALLKYAFAFLIMLDFPEAGRAAAEGCKLARERITRDQLRGIRGALCRLISGDPRQSYT